MSIPNFPKLEPFILKATQRANIEMQFNLVLANAKLEGLSKDKTRRTLLNNYKVSGVYFWIMSIGENHYSIYIGKTKSLKCRMGDYMREFQPHSPNDYKIRIFQQAIIERAPQTNFMLYFVKASDNIYTNLETELIKDYDPLLNRLDNSAAREAFCKAFELFYRAGFEAHLSA